MRRVPSRGPFGADHGSAVLGWRLTGRSLVRMQYLHQGLEQGRPIHVQSQFV